MTVLSQEITIEGSKMIRKELYGTRSKQELFRAKKAVIVEVVIVT
jgi:hypothetical protein